MDGLAAEHVDDALPVLAQYADVLAVRAFAGLSDPVEDRDDPWLKAFVRHAGGKPVISLESARFHPLQGLADTATWVRRLGRDLRGRRLTLTWAPHPKALPQAVPHQVLLSAALQGMDITLAHPEGFEPDPEVTQRVAALASAQGGGLRVLHDPDQGVAGAEVVVAKAWSGWSGYADRADEARRRASLGHWRLSAERMAKAAPGAGFMHCLPVRRNVVVDDAVIDGPQSWVQEEAGFRLWTKVALLERTLQET
jgi:N-acetylornithine carbamoyltransferase